MKKFKYLHLYYYETAHNEMILFESRPCFPQTMCRETDIVWKRPRKLGSELIMCSRESPNPLQEEALYTDPVRSQADVIYNTWNNWKTIRSSVRYGRKYLYLYPGSAFFLPSFNIRGQASFLTHVDLVRSQHVSKLSTLFYRRCCNLSQKVLVNV